MTDPRSNFLVCWPMGGERACIQNAIIVLDDIGEPFDPAAPWGWAGPGTGQTRTGTRYRSGSRP
jgi:hypothetical protein